MLKLLKLRVSEFVEIRAAFGENQNWHDVFIYLFWSFRMHPSTGCSQVIGFLGEQVDRVMANKVGYQEQPNIPLQIIQQ